MSGVYDDIRYKIFIPDSYYHIYSRGINKQEIFHEEADYGFFLSVIKRLLSKKPVINKFNHRPYANFYGRIEVLAFAIMPNHFHLLVYQVGERDASGFVKSLLTAYSKYYNQKYKRLGPVFQSRYVAKKIIDDKTLVAVSRYIHLNPADWQLSELTSLDFFSGKRQAEWVSPQKIMDNYSSFESYFEFLKNFNPDKDEICFEIELK